MREVESLGGLLGIYGIEFNFLSGKWERGGKVGTGDCKEFKLDKERNAIC